MILVPPNRALYAAVDSIDFRRSFDALVAIAREQLGLDAKRRARPALSACRFRAQRADVCCGA